MKNKLIAVVILITMILPMVLNLYKVEAFSGELDPEGYISMPFNIWVQNGIGTGTISLSSRASGYSIAYQKVDVTETQYNSINNKMDELNNYIDECKNDLKIKKAEMDTLKNEYDRIKNSEAATEEQITEALNTYNSAVEKYNQFFDTCNTNKNKLEKEYYEKIPTYTSAWTETTNTDKNVELDLKDYSGKTHFVLWVKITNGTNTYYDMTLYSAEIKNDESITISKTSVNIKVDETLQLTATSSTSAEITWTSSNDSVATVTSEGLVKGIKEGTAVITAKGKEKNATCTVKVEPKATTGTEENDDGDWTDFSKAKFELKKDGVSNAILEISNVTPKDEGSYYLFITANDSKPNVTSKDENRIYIRYNKDSKKLYVTEIEKYVELNQDLYVTILEQKDYKTEKVVLYGEKLERYAEPKYSDAFFATHMTYDSTQLITRFTHDIENNRNIQVKVGKITDVSILKKIKNKDSSGFADLLSFAKSNNGIYNEKHEADKYHNIAYISDNSEETGNNVAIDLKGLQDEEYYFLYIKVYDDDGKYFGQEAVTLAQASTYNTGSWYLFFYGNEDFKWADFGETEPNDDTKAPVTLPDTGIGKYVAIISVLAVVVAVSYIQVKKMKEIR